MSRRAAALLLGLMLLAAALRFGAIVYTHATQYPAEENRIIAANVAAGRGFSFTEFGITGPTAIRGPAYPLLLALTGPGRVKFILAMNVVAGAASVWAAFILARRMTGAVPANDSAGPRHATPAAAWVAAAAFALWPTQVYTATLPQGLSIAVPLALAALALALRRTPPAAISAGILGGLAALTEPALALPLLLSSIAIGWRRHATAAALFAVVAGVTLSPWLYRNALVFGGPMPITSNFWRDAFYGNGPDRGSGTSSARARAVRALKPDDYDRLKVPEPQRLDVYRAWAIGWISRHPLAYLRCCVGRACEIYTTAPDPSRSDRGVGAFTVLFVVSRVAAACWPLLLLIPQARSAHSLGLPLLLIAGFVFTSAFTLATARDGVLMDLPQLIAIAVVVGPLTAVHNRRMMRPPKVVGAPASVPPKGVEQTS